MSRKRPNPDLEICFQGAELFPESIPVRSLADTLSAIHRLALRKDDDEEQDLVPIRLLDVKRGSARFLCVADEREQIIDGLRRAGRWLEDPECFDELAYALSPVRRLSEVASALECPIVIRDASDHNEVLVRIFPRTYRDLSNTLLVTGDKTLRGSVQRVGGATETKCALRVSFQTRLLICKVRDEDVVRALAKYLYEDVEATGTAQWIKRNWRIVGFEIREVHQPQSGVLTEAFDALRKAGGNAWDDIEDPESFIEEVTGRS